jgi:hypothetical protein
MISYLHSGVLDEYDVIEFAAYEYGTDTTTQLLTWAHAGLLIRSTFVSKGFLLHADDRYFYKDSVVFPNDVARVSLVTVSREDHEPLVHHYSFARSSVTNRNRKVLLSGHYEDRNTVPFVHTEVSSLWNSRRASKERPSDHVDYETVKVAYNLSSNGTQNKPFRVVAPFIVL